MPVKVGIVDSGLAPALAGHVAATADFAAPVAIRTIGIAETAAVTAGVDPLGHGSAVAALILAHAPAARLLSAQAFGDSRSADAGRVAQGILWCLEQGAQIINLSLGLRIDAAQLGAAVAAAVARGIILVAASPARGGSVFPAAYPGVFAVSGDARCAAHTWSVLAAGRHYGTTPLAADGRTPGGASFAAARLSGLAARFLAAQAGASIADFRYWLAAGAAYHGREQRQSAVPA